MTDRILIEGERAGSRIVEVEGDPVVLGSEGADIRLDVPGVQARELVLVRTAGGYRAEPGRPADTLTVNGEELLCKDLAPGDVLELAGLRLCWLGAAGLPVAPAAGRRGAGRSPELCPGRPGRRTARARSAPSRVVVGIAMVLGAAALVLAVRFFSGTTWPRTPQHHVDLAREQYLRGSPEQALAQLEFALREATGPSREQALALQAEIQAQLALRADLPALQSARQAAESLASFAARYLAASGERPAARELVRLCDAWLQKYREICMRHADERRIVQQVEALRARHLDAARMAEPDTAADVRFAARCRLRFMVREYREAVAILDQWLQSHPEDAAVRAEREAIVGEGLAWCRQRLRFVDDLLERGRARDAGQELDALERHALLPGLEGEFAERRRRLLPAGR